MLDNHFKYSGVLARHQSAPLQEERERYLAHRASERLAADTLRSLAGKLLIVTQHIVIDDNIMWRTDRRSRVLSWISYPIAT